MRFERFPMYNIDPAGEQFSDVAYQPDVGEQIEFRAGIELYHDVHIAVRPSLTPSYRPEQGGVEYTPRQQIVPVAHQNGHGFLAIHQQTLPQVRMPGT